jgi:aminoglycoside 6'-N-acetyltransferase
MTVLSGEVITLRPAASADVTTLMTIREQPEVRRRWGGTEDLMAEILDDLATPELHVLVIEHDGRIVGAIQWAAEEDPMYHHASIDLYVDPAVHGRGLAPTRSGR